MMCLSITLLPVPLRPRMQNPHPAGMARLTSIQHAQLAEGLGHLAELDGRRRLMGNGQAG
jgi:hypothetical protein